MRWAWIDVRFRFWRRVALAAERYLAEGRFVRKLKWRAMTAYSPIHIRAKLEAGCVQGCQSFPHPGKPCWTMEDFNRTFEPTGGGTFRIRR